MNAKAAEATLDLVDQEGQLTDSFGQSLKLAFELHNTGRGEEAAAICRVLLHLRPHDAQLLFLFGMVLHKAKRDKEAVRWLSLAALYEPDSARIHGGLGCAWQNLGDYLRAAAAFERALELEPDSGANHYNLGRSCYSLEQVDRATDHFRRAVELNPRDFASWNNLGKCLKELNRLEESIAAYDRAVELNPDYSLAHYGRALSLLSAGRLAEGFSEYEWRWHTMKRRNFPQPAWQGEVAPGKTLFIHAEQGFGDAIQMARFVAEAGNRVGQVILECRPELFTLFQHSRCAETVIPFGAPIPRFDYFIPMLSLPRVLAVTRETIPSRAPYLQAPPSSKLPAGSRSGHLNVGLAWAGNPGHNQDAARSLRLQSLAPLLEIPGVNFFSLQREVPAADKSWLSLVADVVASDLVFEDFLQTASFINELDLVITVDTSVAHLAGALGKPVWLLLQHSADWRWFLDRADTPWYPTMQLYRQTERGRWDQPIAQVADALRQKSISRAAGHLARILPAVSEKRRKNLSGLKLTPPPRMGASRPDFPSRLRRGRNLS
jgi:tetratricopeptide (TPR) repeat protein